ncbi:hypothetical protein ACN9MB_11115 [Dyella kyungheensis]|jgi:hypothetical protein|uniref:hypothetical protein n=1 Tax=Dyella kyungheensis TaxID=1242174 RepID=UPI003CF0694F
MTSISLSTLGLQPFTHRQAGYSISLPMNALKNFNAMSMQILHEPSSLPQQGDAVALARMLYAEFEDMMSTLEPLPFPTRTFLWAR